jgi:hypothetical protein
MNQESFLLLVVFLLLGGIFSLTNMVWRQRAYLRCLDIKLNALLKAQGVDWPSLSPEVQRLALDPGKKIAAIKLHREENPDIGIAEAKAEVEAFSARKR